MIDSKYGDVGQLNRYLERDRWAECRDGWLVTMWVEEIVIGLGIQSMRS